MKVVTYSMLCDNRGVQHFVGEDNRTLCGFPYNAMTYGYRIGGPGTDFTYPEDCGRCEVQLTRFHGQRPEDHRMDPEPF